MFTELYNGADRKNNEELASEYLVNDTLIKKLFGPHKSKQITAMDMESKAPYPFVPSMFYTFMYASPDEEYIENKAFKDVVPMILCFGLEKEYVSGLNFNMIPCDVRASILDLIYNSNKAFYQRGLSDAVAKGTFVVNTNLCSQLISEPARKNFLQLLNKHTGLNISSTYRRYNIKYIQNVRMIEYDTWKYIPFLTFKDAVRGIPLAELQAKLVNDSAANK